jgi:hypothetical protein
MRRFLPLLFLMSCSRAPTRAQCEQLLAHLTRLELREAGTAPELEKDILAEIGGTALDHCLHHLPLARVECALRAQSIEQAALCDSQ